MAHHGRSPEEQELAGEEEMGFSLGDIWKKVVSFTRTPQGAAVSALFLPAPVAAALAASQARRPAPTPAAPARKPATGARPPQSQQPADSANADPPTGPPSSSDTSGWYRKGWIMGAAPPMSDADIMTLIKREKDPRKKARMIDNFNRARQRRGW